MEKNKETIGSRISELMFRFKKNQSSFADSVGVSQTAIYNTINGKTKPRYDLIQAILNAYPDINKDWLISGDGEMLNNTIQSEIKNKPEVIGTNSDGGTMLEALKDQYEKRIDELTRYVSNLEYTVNLQKNMLGNFNDPTTGETEVIRMYTDAELLMIQNPRKLAIC